MNSVRPAPPVCEFYSQNSVFFLIDGFPKETQQIWTKVPPPLFGQCQNVSILGKCHSQDPSSALIKAVFLKFCQYWLYLAEKGYHQINGSSYAELIDSCINMFLARAMLIWFLGGILASEGMIFAPGGMIFASGGMFFAALGKWLWAKKVLFLEVIPSMRFIKKTV